MKPNDDSSVEKLTVENKNQVLEAVVDDMTKHDVVYVAIKEITDAEGTTTITQPKDDDIFDGAKSMIEMEGKVKKPSDDQVEHRIKKDLAAAKMLIRKYVQKVDQPKMKRAAGSAPSAMYEWMTEYGKEGDASRLGHLADKLRAIKMTSSKYQNMHVYFISQDAQPVAIYGGHQGRLPSVDAVPFLGPGEHGQDQPQHAGPLPLDLQAACSQQPER
jgi:hypothetical protein